jgi:hypothetical protein
MRDLRELFQRWLERIPAREEEWHPDPEAEQAARRVRELKRQLAELNVYVDVIRPPRRDDGRDDRRAV